jgi:hypothetical protein
VISVSRDSLASSNPLFVPADIRLRIVPRSKRARPSIRTRSGASPCSASQGRPVAYGSL